MSATVTVTGWRSGAAAKETGVTYGVRFGSSGKVLVEGKPTHVQLRLAGGPVIDAKITPGFWRKCPEVRDRRIGSWLVAQGIVMPWPLGAPPRFAMNRIGKNEFSISAPL